MKEIEARSPMHKLPPQFSLVFGDFMARLNNLDRMTRSGKPPLSRRTSEHLVEELYKAALKSMAAWECLHPLTGLDDNSILVLISYLEFVYLVKPRRRLTLANIREEELQHFLSGAPARGELRKIIADSKSWTVLNYFYFMLADLNYTGIARPIRALKRLMPIAQNHAQKVPA